MQAKHNIRTSTHTHTYCKVTAPWYRALALLCARMWLIRDRVASACFVRKQNVERSAHIQLPAKYWFRQRQTKSDHKEYVCVCMIYPYKDKAIRTRIKIIHTLYTRICLIWENEIYSIGKLSYDVLRYVCVWKWCVVVVVVVYLEMDWIALFLSSSNYTSHLISYSYDTDNEANGLYLESVLYTI